MGKNKGKKGVRTEFAKWTSVMRKLSNEVENEKQREKAANKES